MPRSFQRRRGKPRLELQQENADLSLESQQPTSSLLSKIKSDNKKNDNESSTAKTDKELEDKMWKHVSVSKDDPIAAPLQRSLFAVRFPQTRESYIRTVFGKMKRHLKQYGIHLDCDYSNSVLTVSTTDRTWDPYSVIKARDMMRLIARYVPFEQASKVLDDETFSDIIEIGKTQVARNQVRFIKRRSRLIGPNGVTLRAIELLTKCYVLVYGRTVCVIGPMHGISQVRKIVLDCMRNIHPIYALKRLMVLNELKGNADMKNERWNRFLPSFKKVRRDSSSAGGAAGNGRAGKTLAQIKKKMQKKRSKKYTPYPPAPTMSKIDIAMESGEYWNQSWRRENLKRVKKEDKYKEYLKRKDAQNREKEWRRRKEEKIAKKMRKFEAMEAPQEIAQGAVEGRLNVQNRIGKSSNGMNGMNAMASNMNGSARQRNETLKANVAKIEAQSGMNSSNNDSVSRFLLE